MKRLSNLYWAIALLTISTSANAMTLGEIADNVIRSISSVSQLAGAIGYMIAFFFVLAAIFKLKQHGDDAERYTLRAPIFLFICAILAAYMTSVLTTGNDTFWGGAGQTQGIDGSNVGSGL